MKYLHTISDDDDDKIQTDWGKCNEVQLKVLLRRYQKFFGSPITQTIYVLQDKLESLSNNGTFYSNLEMLTLS